MNRSKVQHIENHLSLQVDNYKDMPLPEDYEITNVLGDVIMGNYADIAPDGKSLMRNGIILPVETVDNRAWRVVKVVLVGPKVEQVKVGDVVMIPGDKGLLAIQKSGNTCVFFNEERIFGICKQVENPREVYEPKKTKKGKK